VDTAGPSGGVCEISDEVLLSLTGKGDQEALSLLFQRHARVVRNVGRRILRDDSEADDLIQEVFLYVFKKRETIDVDVTGKIKRFLLHVSYHLALDRISHLKARIFQNHELMAENEPWAKKGRHFDFDEWICHKVCLERALDSLPVEQRTVITKKCQGYSFQELGDQIGESYGNVRNIYYRGLDKLRRVLGSEQNGEKLPE